MNDFYANSNIFLGYKQMGIQDMSLHFTIAIFKVEGYWEEGVISEQQREVLQSLHWLVFVFPLLAFLVFQ